MIIRFLVILVLAGGMLGGGYADRVYAQTEQGAQAQQAGALTDESGRPNYDDWDSTAARAEDVIASEQASDQALEDLRSQLVRWREVFLTRQDSNRPRIETLRQQIEALGPKPEGDATEPDQIATRRADLEAALANAQAPIRRAEEAFRQSSGLISQIDTILREREADRLLRLDPTPLNPVNWPAGLAALRELGDVIGSETSRNMASPSQQRDLKNNAPIALILVGLGIVLVFRGSTWVERIIRRLRERRGQTGATFRAATFVGSLLGIALPTIGVICIVQAVNIMGLAGPNGNLLLGGLASTILLLAISRWLSLRVFPAAPDIRPLIQVTPLQAREARSYAIIATLMYSLSVFVTTLASESLALSSVFDLTAQSVLRFPLIVIAGFMLFRLGQQLIGGAQGRSTPPSENDDADAEAAQVAEDAPAALILRLLGRASCVIAVVGPLLAAIGYVAAGSDLVFSAIMTVALFGLIAVVQKFARDIYAIITKSDQTTAALIPVLVDFAIIIAALPILALIWGARVTDLSEAWTYIENGFQIGESRISPLDFMTFVLVFVIGYGLTRLFQRALKSQVLPKTRIDVGGQNAVVSGVGYIGIFLAALAAITSAGLDLSSLAIVAGALSVGIGFGLQTIVSNFVSGIILLIERPVSEGDWIEVGGTMGVVKDISVRATRIETFDRRDVIVPNADLISTAVTNWTKGNLNARIIVPVGVAYGTNTRKVEEILREIVEAEPLVILNPPPAVLFTGFGADSLDFEIRAIIRDVNYVVKVPSDINHRIAERFEEEGIEIPFAQRDVWLRNPETLRDVKQKDEDTEEK